MTYFGLYFPVFSHLCSALFLHCFCLQRSPLVPTEDDHKRLEQILTVEKPSVTHFSLLSLPVCLAVSQLRCYGYCLSERWSISTKTSLTT